jgi:hypothetical protein
MNYSMLNEKKEENILFYKLIEFKIIITYSFLFYLNSCLGLKKIKTCDIMAQGLIRLNMILL